MSASFFSTILSCDARSPDGRAVEYAAAGTGFPRRRAGSADGWISCQVRVEDVLKIAAATLEETEMDGLSGDHPEKRARLARVLEAAAKATRELALDADCDAATSDEEFEALLAEIRAAAAPPTPAGWR